MVGSVLSTRYELLENIGAGGMAIVYKAKCRLLNRNVAVKILRPEFQEDEEFLKRFTIEAQAAASLSHPNVVSVYDVGRHGKLNYIVMECIEGITLKEYMQRKGALSINEAVDFTSQIASALEHAHSKGIIHRDIKPHNIILTNEGILKVTDFGLARAVSESTTVANSTAIGSVHYASPEQARGGFTDQRSDIYSLGVVMYEMFTGTLPFDGDTPVAVAMKHLEETPMPPSLHNSQISKELEAIILKAMAKDQNERYASVAGLLTDLHLLFGTEPAPVHTDKFSTRKLPHLEDGEKDKGKKGHTPSKENKKKEDAIAIGAAIATALVLISLLAFFLMRFLVPSGTKGQITVPSLLNMSIEEAREKYKDIQIEEQGASYSSTIPEGFIMEQDKGEGTPISAGDRVMVTISRGAQRIELANYKGEDYRRVERELKEMGLVPQISEEHSDDISAGDVIRTNPDAGYALRTGDTVILHVSRGKSEVEVAVPALLGMTEEEARRAIRENDLSVGNVTQEASSGRKGSVIRQSVPQGTMISSGTAIDLVISSGQGDAPAQIGTYTLRLDLPQEKENATIRVVEGTKTLFEGAFETKLSPITIHLKGTVGSAVVSIYLDNTIYKENVPVTFE